MQAVKQMVRKFVPRPIQTPPSPVAAQKSEYSSISSVFDEPGHATQRLVELAIEAAEKGIELEEYRPGEELGLLGGLMLAMRPTRVAQVGPENQRATAVMKKYLPEGAMQVEHSQAQFILINGPGDGEFEKSALELLAKLRATEPRVVMFNDTRLWPMIRFCRDIRYPKLDLTSFGRWTGTLLVELVGA